MSRIKNIIQESSKISSKDLKHCKMPVKNMIGFVFYLNVNKDSIG